MLLSILTPVALWFLFLLANLWMEPSRELDLTLRLNGEWPNGYNPCIMQNITEPPPVGFISASETIAFCKQKFSAPLTVNVQFDKNPDSMAPIAFPSTRTVEATVTLQGNTFFANLQSPSILPYQIFIVTAFSKDKTPPLATRITITPIQPDK